MLPLDSVTILKRKLLLKQTFDVDIEQQLSQILQNSSEKENEDLVSWLLKLLGGQDGLSVHKPQILVQALAMCALTHHSLRTQIFNSIPESLPNPSLLFFYLYRETIISTQKSGVTAPQVEGTSNAADVPPESTQGGNTSTVHNKRQPRKGGNTGERSTGEHPRMDASCRNDAIAGESDSKLVKKKKEKVKKMLCTKKPKFGRNQRTAIGKWYTRKGVMTLALHVTKYRRRNGWSHKDLLKLSHVKPPKDNPGVALVLKYAQKGFEAVEKDYKDKPEKERTQELSMVYEYLSAVEQVRHSKDEQLVIKLIKEYKLVHEHIPTWHKKSKWVWRALAEHMPVLATLRNLTRLASLSLLDENDPDNCIQLLVDRFSNTDLLLAARVHPFNILLALREYEKGIDPRMKAVKLKRILSKQGIGLHLDRKFAAINLTELDAVSDGNTAAFATDATAAETKVIPANPKIIAALDKAILHSFGTIKPTGKSLVVAIDMHESMKEGRVLFCPFMTPLQASVALATLLLHCEGSCQLVALYPDRLIPVTLGKNLTLANVEKSLISAGTSGAGASNKGDRTAYMGRLVDWAKQSGQKIDAFIVLTNQRGHPRCARVTGIGSSVPVVVDKITKDQITSEKSELKSAGESPKVALYRYHNMASNTDTRLVYVSLTCRETSYDIYDDARLLGLNGFQPSMPDVINSFVVGKLDPVKIAASA